VRERINEFRGTLGAIASQIESQRRVLDVYRPQTFSPQSTVAFAGEELLQTLLIQPEYEYPEIITGIVITGPVASQTSITVGTAPAGITNPGANATIVSIGATALQAIGPPGTAFDIQWTALLEGTIAAGDQNNMYLSSPLNTNRQQGEFPGVVGTYPQQGLRNFVPGSAGINVQANAAASGVAAIYAAEITATPSAPVDAPFTLKLGSRVWNLYLPSTGFVNMFGLRLRLTRSSDRLLTSLVPGDWSVELMGYADVGRGFVGQ